MPSVRGVPRSLEPLERLVRRMVLLNLVALVAAYMSGHWDAAMHARGEVEQFWYPPHYGIYFALGTAAAVSLVGVAVLLRSSGSGAARLRALAALVLIVVANTIGFTGAPFDAWWHEAYGFDLSVWSPPHVHLLAGMVLAALAASLYFLDSGPAAAGLRSLRALGRRSAGAVAGLVMGVLLGAFLFFEYESGLANAEVLGRPPWTYPVVWTAFATFAVAVSAAVLRVRGAATLVAAIYTASRIAVLGVDRALLGFDGAVPYPLVIPAVVFDLAAAYAWRGGGIRLPSLYSGAAGALAALAIALTAPPFWSAFGTLPTTLVDPWSSAWPFSVLAGTGGALIGWWGGTALRRLRPRPVEWIGPHAAADAA